MRIGNTVAVAGLVLQIGSTVAIVTWTAAGQHAEIQVIQNDVENIENDIDLLREDVRDLRNDRISFTDK